MCVCVCVYQLQWTKLVISRDQKAVETTTRQYQCSVPTSFCSRVTAFSKLLLAAGRQSMNNQLTI